MLKSNKLRFRGWDFDGTLVETKQSNNFSLINAKPIYRNIKILREQAKLGYKIFIFTSRAWVEYIDIKEWLVRHKIPFKAILCGKPLFLDLWDDRAINPNCKECLQRAIKE